MKFIHKSLIVSLSLEQEESVERFNKQCKTIFKMLIWNKLGKKIDFLLWNNLLHFFWDIYIYTKISTYIWKKYKICLICTALLRNSDLHKIYLYWTVWSNYSILISYSSKWLLLPAQGGWKLILVSELKSSWLFLQCF